jgi:hypothetical protein
MPTVLRVGPYRCFFFAGDRNEPPHVHVERDTNRAKVWLDPFAFTTAAAFPAASLLVSFSWYGSMKRRC